MATKSSREEFWHMSDELWNLVAPILGPDKAPGTPGRPARPNRVIFEAVLDVLRTGCHWHTLPRRHFAPPTTVHTRFSRWARSGVLDRALEVVARYYERRKGVRWRWQALDTATTKAPLGGEKTGKSPVDRVKLGTKRLVLVDQRGAPLAVEVAGANRHDKKLAEATVDAAVLERPKRKVYRTQHLSIDKAYDFDDTVGELEARDYRVHRRRRGEPKLAPEVKRKYPARRWIVEHTHSWHNRFRRLLMRWEKQPESYEAMVTLASMLMLFGLATRPS
jgi:putative transposase